MTTEQGTPTAESACPCPPCPGRGNDGHGMAHCAECCWGTGVEADLTCPLHGDPCDESEWAPLADRVRGFLADRGGIAPVADALDHFRHTDSQEAVSRELARAQSHDEITLTHDLRLRLRPLPDIRSRPGQCATNDQDPDK